jgi:5-methylcytosine-specific restriction protein A
LRKPRQAEHDAQRGTAAQRGYGARWQRVRLRFLKTHPLCAECERSGLVTAATDVHHLVPRRSGGPDAESNFEALCHECHSRITAQGG